MLCEQALAIDPAYPPAAGLISWCRMTQRYQGWGSLSEADVAEAVRLARQAVEAGKDDPDTLSNAALALSLLAGNHALAGTAADRALTLNPNSALAWMARGWVFVFQGQPEPAFEAFENSLRLSPLDPFEYYSAGGIAFAHALAGQYEAATEWADRCLRELPRYAPVIRLKAAACAQIGRIEQAREAVRLQLEIAPGHRRSLTTGPMRRRSCRRHSPTSSSRVCAKPAFLRNDREPRD